MFNQLNEVSFHILCINVAFVLKIHGACNTHISHMFIIAEAKMHCFYFFNENVFWIQENYKHMLL